VSLVDHALEAIADEASVEQLQRKLAASAGERETIRATREETELELRAARQRDEAAAHVYEAVAERARQQ